MRSYKEMPKTVGAYADCKHALDAAIAKGGVKVTFATKGNATHFRHRCNAFKRLMLEAAIESVKLTPGVLAATIYDPIYMVIDPKEPCIVRIHPMRPIGELSTFSGEPVTEFETINLSPLEKDAVALKQELGLDL